MSSQSDPKFAAFQTSLNQMGEQRITGERFLQQAEKNGLTQAEGSTYLHELHESGKVFHFEEGGVNYVYLDSGDITRTLSELLDPSGQTVKKMVREKQLHLSTLSSEMEEMMALKSVIERRADQSVRRIMWSIVTYLGIQVVVVTRLTFWDLSWDIMEPITYMVSVFLGGMGVWWFGITKTDPAYANIWNTFSVSRTRRFANKMGFDESRFLTLQKEMLQTQDDLALWQDGVSRNKV